jgi:hypothetical protein
MVTLLYVVTVLTAWGQRISNEAVLLINLSPEAEEMLGRFAMLLNPLSIALMVGTLVIIGWRRDRLRLGIACAGGYLIAILAAETLKRVLPRPDLAVLTNPIVGDTNSFPSGTAVITTSFVIGLVIVSAPPWRLWIALIGGAVAVSFMVAAFCANWHRIPDLLAGIALSFGVMGVAWWAGSGAPAAPGSPAVPSNH